MSIFDKIFRRKSIKRIKNDEIFDAELRLHNALIAAESYRNSAAKEEADARMLVVRIKRLKAELGIEPEEATKTAPPAQPEEKPAPAGRRLRAAS